MENKQKYGIGLFGSHHEAKRHTLCPFDPYGMFHCINVIPGVLWLIGINLRLAQIIAAVNNNASTKCKHSEHVGQ